MFRDWIGWVQSNLALHLCQKQKLVCIVVWCSGCCAVPPRPLSPLSGWRYLFPQLLKCWWLTAFNGFPSGNCLSGNCYLLHTQWLFSMVYKGLAALPQLKTTLRGHPSSLAPCGISCSLCCDCIQDNFSPAQFCFLHSLPGVDSINVFQQTSCMKISI